MAEGKFGTAINCMDGRTQIPVSDWIKEKYNIDYIDTITEPGVDKVMSSADVGKLEQVKSKVLISINKHGSTVIAVAGHHDCAGNPVSKEEHISQIKKSVDTIKSWELTAQVVGLWVNENWKIEPVSE